MQRGVIILTGGGGAAAGMAINTKIFPSQLSSIRSRSNGITRFFRFGNQQDRQYSSLSLPSIRGNTANAGISGALKLDTNLTSKSEPRSWVTPTTSLNAQERLCAISSRSFSSSSSGTEGEKKLKETLSKTFPKATTITVEDISGGCGSMYQIYIESIEFKGLPMVKQHILVNTALKKEIKEMHGLRIQTAVPKS